MLSKPTATTESTDGSGLSSQPATTAMATGLTRRLVVPLVTPALRSPMTTLTVTGGRSRRIPLTLPVILIATTTIYRVTDTANVPWNTWRATSLRYRRQHCRLLFTVSQQRGCHYQKGSTSLPLPHALTWFVGLLYRGNDDINSVVR